MSYQAISSTASAHVFNIAVPSLETVIDRTALWSSTVTLRITGNMDSARPADPNKPAGMMLVNYGVTDALSTFPPTFISGDDDGDHQQQHGGDERRRRPPCNLRVNGRRGVGLLS